MAIKIMPAYGLFACREDAQWRILCSMALASAPATPLFGGFLRSLASHFTHAGRESKPPSP